MDDTLAIDLEEFRQLRSEINNRTTLGNQLVQYTVALLAGALVALDKFPDIVLGLAVIVTWFWLLWIDHTGQVYKLAFYISTRLASRLREKAGDVLEREGFLRAMDAGRILRTVTKTGSSGINYAFFFGSIGPVLLSLYSFAQARIDAVANAHNLNLYLGGRILAIVVIVIFWSFAVFRHVRMIRMAGQIHTAILSKKFG
jgi:hypothetical protein